MYREFKDAKILYIFDKTLALSIICGKCSRKDKEIFKKEKSIEILKILVWMNNMLEYQMNL